VAIPAIVHILGEDAIYGELDQLPSPTDQFVVLRNLMQKDRKPLPYLMDGAQVFLYAWHKITFIEILTDVAMPATNGTGPTPASVGATGNLKPAGTTVLGFFRDDDL
jgi:hypothetical protein